jgi:hypothetical protein
LHATPSAAAERLFDVAAFLEGFTRTGLLIGVAFKCGAVGSDPVIKVFGPLYGGAFLF